MKEYCIIIVVKFGIGSLEVYYSYFVFIIVVVVVGGLCLMVGLCGVVLFMVRWCLIDKDSVVVFEDCNFGFFWGILLELLFNVSMSLLIFYFIFWKIFFVVVYYVKYFNNLLWDYVI